MFNKGDKVLCISSRRDSKLVVGNEYTIEKYWLRGKDAFVKVVEVNIPDHAYFSHRFKASHISLENK